MILNIKVPADTIIDYIEMYDITGRKITNLEYVNGAVGVSKLAAGSYILKVTSGNYVAVKRFLKE